MPYGGNPSAGKVNPNNGAVVPRDEDLFDSEEEFEELKADFDLDDYGVRLGRGLNLI
jgi:hypothetical protein